MISLNQEVCSDLASATRREWLETNGLGGYASSTVAGINSRRYHGLLVAAEKPPLGRAVLLSKFEETLIVDGSAYGISANRYPGAIHPEGYRFLRGFRLDPYPVWTYEVAGVVLEKRHFMPYGRNAIACSWRVLSDKDADRHIVLELKPLIAYRDYHHLGSQPTDVEGSFESIGGKVSVRSADGTPRLFFDSPGARVEQTGHWYRDFVYEIEKKRGFDFAENLFQPFSLGLDLAAPARLIASTDENAAGDWEELEAAELRRRAGLVARLGSGNAAVRQLALAADQYIVQRGNGRTVIAGYPWFSDWGRDTMIALPGLTLSTGRPELARDILLEFANHVSEGMLPNRFPDEGEEPEYNTVDATLWYFEAVRAYLEATGDTETVGERLYGVLSGIVDWHVRGTRYNIRVDDDGLLNAGEEGVQLTWMDARIGARVVTPRIGKPVEIQALWYNALRTMEDLAGTLGNKGDALKYASLAQGVKKSFARAFWNEELECLYDVVTADGADASLRPNQIFAVSLHHSMLTKEKSKKVVAKVEEHLLTPFGLRSLAPFESDYARRYEGGPVERDSAYHQGTVWAWLIGPFIDAYRRVNPKGAKTEARIRALAEGLIGHLSDAGLNQVSEIFDAEPPHEPRGCFAQAWSVAELLRVLKE